MSELLLHQASKQALDTLFVLKNTQALLISGPDGVGLSTIATYYAQKQSNIVIPILPEKNEKVDIEKGTITVDIIRRLYNLTKTVSPKTRVVLIDYAERMGAPAQNAFLKLLEEPPKNTFFILLSHTPENLLPTIHSRVRSVDLRPITVEQSNQLLDTLNVHDAQKRAQLLFVAKGLPAALTRFVADEDLFTVRAGVVRDARAFIGGTPYQRLLLAKQYGDNRDKALLLVSDMAKQLQNTAESTGNGAVVAKIKSLEHIYTKLIEQGNVRLQLSSLSVL